MPLVSVVIATHNRPAALRQTLFSVLRQTLQDFEILVIGDDCRPETPAIIAEFADPRIFYIDLPVNFGEQSGPNNIGFARARGRLVAVLNHDDLWFPDHLAATTGWIDATGADVVIARGAIIEPVRTRGDALKTSIYGMGKDGFYDPVVTAGYGSAQVVRRASLDWLGPWRPAGKCSCESSQDWLFRAWRKGAVIATMPHLTVLSIFSGQRPGLAKGSRDRDHAASDGAEHLLRPAERQLSRRHGDGAGGTHRSHAHTGRPACQGSCRGGGAVSPEEIQLSETQGLGCMRHSSEIRRVSPQIPTRCFCLHAAKGTRPAAHA
ncbi:glycosyltransferase family 2 protein [Mesorhizobium sp. LNHC229A00]|uniref:glycosyltransferase family 2 protein n=1 Tax=Mesorhizobium sp. LNHC229A00 TaxID=1287240 RepID=UPI001FDA9247|nr:glycosyltransferase family 2 protein [Mesorhizobium sp. LNHC229A00]